MSPIPQLPKHRKESKMKGKIFIAWSGTNELAKEVTRLLRTQKYEGVVGGQTGQAGSLFVGAAVLHEINQCNQAIFIMQKKKESGSISGNVLFELGYALSRFDVKKIHVFYIDIERGDRTIPSDLEGIWANYMTFKGMSETALEIVNIFLANQKIIIPEEKMQIIDSHYNVKDRIFRYPTSPYCSEYEFSQYILFYSQSAYMFRCENDGIKDLKMLIRELPAPSNELDGALTFAVNYLNLFKAIKSEDSRIYLERRDFRDFKEDFTALAEEVSEWQENDFTCWFLALTYDVLNYIHVLYASSPDISQELYIHTMKQSIAYGEKFFVYAEKLENNEQADQNRQCIKLYKAYIYRNFTTAYEHLKDSEGFENAPLLKKENMQKSLAERRSLWRYYKSHSINSKLLENFEMEYYLALSESLEYMEDVGERMEAVEDCKEYVERVRQMHKEQNFFVNKIDRGADSV